MMDFVSFQLLQFGTLGQTVISVAAQMSGSSEIGH